MNLSRLSERIAELQIENGKLKAQINGQGLETYTQKIYELEKQVKKLEQERSKLQAELRDIPVATEEILIETPINITAKNSKEMGSYVEVMQGDKIIKYIKFNEVSKKYMFADFNAPDKS